MRFFFASSDIVFCNQNITKPFGTLACDRMDWHLAATAEICRMIPLAIGALNARRVLLVDVSFLFIFDNSPLPTQLTQRQPIVRGGTKNYKTSKNAFWVWASAFYATFFVVSAVALVPFCFLSFVCFTSHMWRLQLFQNKYSETTRNHHHTAGQLDDRVYIVDAFRFHSFLFFWFGNRGQGQRSTSGKIETDKLKINEALTELPHWLHRTQRFHFFPSFRLIEQVNKTLQLRFILLNRYKW